MKSGFFGSVAFLAAAFCIAGPAVPAAAQSAPTGRLVVPAFAPAVVFPMDRPELLIINFVPSFRFAAEAINSGVVLPGTPNRLLVEGGGRVARGPRSTAWVLSIDRATIDGTVLAATVPLATLRVSIDNNDQAKRAYTAEFGGLNVVPQTMPGSPLRRILRRTVDTLAFALPMTHSQPVADRAPIFDMGIVLARHFARTAAKAEVVQTPGPLFAAGQILHRGRLAVLARTAGPLTVRAAYREATLLSEFAGAIDVATGLPLFMQVQVHGTIDLLPVRGHVDYSLRFAAAIDDMGDPISVLSPPVPETPPPPPVTAGAPASKPKPTAKPSAAPASKPTTAPSKPAVAKPTAKPAEKPAPIAKPAPATDDVGKRLEALKSLFDRGLITKEQYEAKQKEILGSL